MSLDGGRCVWFPGSLLPSEYRALCIAMAKASSIFVAVSHITVTATVTHQRRDGRWASWWHTFKSCKMRKPDKVRYLVQSGLGLTVKCFIMKRGTCLHNTTFYCPRSGCILESKLSSGPCKTDHIPQELKNWCGEIVQLACFPILLKKFTKGLPQSKQKPFLGKTGNTEKSVLSPGSTCTTAPALPS